MLRDHWFKHGDQKSDVRVGAIFRHAMSGNAVETAKVVEVGRDSLGIPHVTYDLKVEKGRLAAYEERRTLGLESFKSRFEETVRD